MTRSSVLRLRGALALGGTLLLLPAAGVAFLPVAAALATGAALAMAVSLSARDERAPRRRQLFLSGAVGDAILAMDGEGIVRFANPAAATLLGRDRQGLLGQPLHLLTGDAAALAGGAGSGVARLVGRGEGRRVRYRARPRTGAPGVVLVLRDLDGPAGVRLQR